MRSQGRKPFAAGLIALTELSGGTFASLPLAGGKSWAVPRPRPHLVRLVTFTKQKTLKVALVPHQRLASAPNMSAGISDTDLLNVVLSDVATDGYDAAASYNS
jgi:hypothetical protein